MSNFNTSVQEIQQLIQNKLDDFVVIVTFNKRVDMVGGILHGMVVLKYNPFTQVYLVLSNNNLILEGTSSNVPFNQFNGINIDQAVNYYNNEVNKFENA
jgi:hypothetical protein